MPNSTAARAQVELTDTQLLALQALLLGASQAEAAAASGAGERSIRRWLHDPVFRSALHQARCDAWGTVTARLQQLAHKAVDALEGLLASDHLYARALAARSVLEYSLRALDADDLTARAAQIEADLEAHLTPPPASDLAPRPSDLEPPPSDLPPPTGPALPPSPPPVPASGSAPASSGLPGELRRLARRRLALLALGLAPPALAPG
jgi:hypothetical protein